MRGADGRILVEGFYDDVWPLSEADRAEIDRVPYNEEEVRQKLGIDAFFGEPGYSTLERSWARPTIEVNGIWGGFQGEGVKTVLPSKAHAKITCRLVADQSPARITELLEAHIQRVAPPGVRATVSIKENGARAYLMPGDHPGNTAARDILVKLYETEPFLARSGGSIPVCGMFLELLGVYTVGFGFGLNDERQHSPNEFFRLSSFERGQQGYCMLLERLAE